MVYETRKVVEDYVLFKIKEHNTSGQSGSSIPNAAASVQAYTGTQFPQPQDPPSTINQAVRLVAHDFEEMYRRQYPDLLEKIRALHIATWDVDEVFTKVTSDVFKMTYKRGSGAVTAGATSSGNRKSRTPSPALQESEWTEQDFTIDDSNVKWGHVIALLVFTGMLAVRCVEINNNQRVDEIVNWVSKFLDTKLSGWLERHGGWDGFVLWYEQSKGSTVSNRFEQHHSRSRIASALRISGAVAAVALGAIVLTRK